MSNQYPLANLKGAGFKPGVSGNPGGRPKQFQSLKQWLLEQFESESGRLMLMKRVAKSDFLLAKCLAYAYGEPQRHDKLDVNQNVITRVIDELADGSRITREVERQAIDIPEVVQ